MHRNHKNYINSIKRKKNSPNEVFHILFLENFYRKKNVLTSDMLIENFWCRHCNFKWCFFFKFYSLWFRFVSVTWGHTPTNRVTTVFNPITKGSQKKISVLFWWCSAHFSFCSYSCSLIDTDFFFFFLVCVDDNKINGG